MIDAIAALLPGPASWFGADEVGLAASVAVLVVAGATALSRLGRTVPVAAAGPGLLLAVAALAAVNAGDLRVLAALLLAVGILELALVPRAADHGRDPATGRPTSSRFAWRLAALVALLSPALVALGALARATAGGTTTVEWIGRPLAGDTPTTLLFVGLVLPLALPPQLGGATHGLAAGPRDEDRGGYVLAGVLRPLVLLAALTRCFVGTSAFAPLGASAAGVALLLSLFGERTAARSFAAAVHAGFALCLAGAATGLEATEDALALGSIGLALAATGTGLALAFATAERAADPGLGPRGLARVHPSLFAFSALSALGLAAAPGHLAYEARARAIGALAAEGEGSAALALTLLAAPIAALAVLPFVVATFFSRAPAGPVSRARGRAPIGLVLATAAMGAGGIVLGLVPGALAPLLPYGVAATDRFPPTLQCAELLVGGALVAVLFARRLLSTRPADEAPLSSSP